MKNQPIRIEYNRRREYTISFFSSLFFSSSLKKAKKKNASILHI